MGSLSELETQIIICKNLNYLTNTDHLQNFIVDLKKMTNGLIKYLKTRKKQSELLFHEKQFTR